MVQLFYLLEHQCETIYFILGKFNITNKDNFLKEDWELIYPDLISASPFQILKNFKKDFVHLFN